MKDNLYKTPQDEILPFAFSPEVAAVFDDMAQRSIPCYRETQDLIAEVTHRLYRFEGAIYDLGCATGATLLALDKKFQNSRLKLCGVDSSESMLEKARQKLGQIKHKAEIRLQCANAAECSLENAEAVLLIYILQFLPPVAKAQLLGRIFQQLPEGGFLLLSEKLCQGSDSFEALYTDVYYEFKRLMGYSQLEIAQKRDALEKSFHRSTRNELELLLKSAGFAQIDSLFQWTHFATFLAVK